MENPNQKSKVIVLRDFFGFSSATQLRDEVKQLSEEERTQLAQQAAAELGLKQDDCAFPLA